MRGLRPGESNRCDLSWPGLRGSDEPVPSIAYREARRVLVDCLVGCAGGDGVRLRSVRVGGLRSGATRLLAGSRDAGLGLDSFDLDGLEAIVDFWALLGDWRVAGV